MTTICPKCGHQRSENDDPMVPDYECPACGIVYAKFKAKHSDTSNQILANIKQSRDAQNRKPAVFEIDDKPIARRQPPIDPSRHEPPDDGIIDGEIVKPLLSRRLQLIIAVGLILLFGAQVYMSPLSFINDFREAIAEMPASDIPNYIDFDQLKTNIKAQVKANMDEPPAELKNNPFYALGTVIGEKMVDTAIDKQVSPDAIKAMFIKRHTQHADPRELIFLHFDYLDYDTVKMDMDSAYLILKRQSLFGWKIVSVDWKKLLN